MNIKFSLLIIIFLVSGCGSIVGKSVAPAKGTITFEGKPVTSGMVVLRPQGSSGDPFTKGNASLGEIYENGTFDFTTYEQFDGALVGVNSIEVIEYSSTSSHPALPIPGKVPDGLTFEVKKDGPNELKLELKPK